MSEVRIGLPAESPGLSPTRAKLLLLSIVATGLAWRCYAVATRPLWFDEALPYFISRLPLAELRDRIKYGDVHPPLYYLLLKGWTQVFGTSPLALRAPSVLGGALAILGVYLFTVEALAGPSARHRARAREIGIWAAALLALSVFQIRWSWDVRPYSIGAALVMFSSWALFRALHSQRTRYAYWLLYVLLSLVFLYMHYLALFTIAAQALFVLGYLAVQARRGETPEAKLPKETSDSYVRRFVRQPQFLPAILVALALCLGWLPWLPVFQYQQSAVQKGPWIEPTSWAMAGVYSYHLMIEPECWVPHGSQSIMVVCALLCVALPLALLWKAKVAEWYVVVCALVPIALAVLASTVLGLRIFYSRYLLFAHLFILLSAALLLGRIRFTWARIGTGALLVLLMLGLDVRYTQELDLAHTPSFGGVVDYVEHLRQPNEPVIVCDQLYYLPLRYQSGSVPGWFKFGGNKLRPMDDDWQAFGKDNVKREQDLDRMTRGYVWVVNVTVEDNGERCEVPVPRRWEVKSVEKFADRYGLKRSLEVVEYRVVGARVGK